MKRILLIAAMLAVIVFSIQAQTVTVSASPTLSWNAVTADANGNSFPTGAVVTYNIVERAPGGTTSATLMTGITATSAKVTGLSAWNLYDLGVEAVVTYQGTSITSPVAWGSAAASPFTVLSGAAPGVPGGLTISP